MFRLTAHTRVRRPLDEVFAFFADAGNLERLTPPWLAFSVLTPQPIVMAPGTLIDYQLRLHGLPFRWRSEITDWQPPRSFVDEQRRGPYRSWRHEHRFHAAADEVVIEDVVRYGVLGGGLVHRLFVEGQLREIFTFRHRTLHQVFMPEAPVPPPDIVISRV